MRVQTIPVSGEAAVFDPADPGKFAELAGDQFVRLDGDTAVIRTLAGNEMTAYPGWLAVRLDGAGGKVWFCSADLFGDEPGRILRAA